MKPYYEHGGIMIYHGDCREILPLIADAALTLTDPPYGLGDRWQGPARPQGEKGETMSNEDTHDWIEIDDGQIVKRCKCGTIQNDDGSVTHPDGHTADGDFPKCDRIKSRPRKARR